MALFIPVTVECSYSKKKKFITNIMLMDNLFLFVV